jgi:hypothetical protein
MKSTALWQKIPSTSAAFQKIVCHKIGQLPFCDRTIDGPEIRSTKLFVTGIIGGTLLGISGGSCTSSVKIVDLITCVTLSETVLRILDKLQTKGNTIYRIPCDGASYLVMTLNSVKMTRQFSHRTVRLNIYSSYCLLHAYVPGQTTLIDHSGELSFHSRI